MNLSEQLQSLAPQVMNVYGPTETTILATVWEAPSHPVARPPIGRPLANTRLYVLDEHRQLVPIGVPGGIVHRRGGRWTWLFEPPGAHAGLLLA